MEDNPYHSYRLYTLVTHTMLVCTMWQHINMYMYLLVLGIMGCHNDGVHTTKSYISHSYLHDLDGCCGPNMYFDRIFRNSPVFYIYLSCTTCSCEHQQFYNSCILFKRFFISFLGYFIYLLILLFFSNITYLFIRFLLFLDNFYIYWFHLRDDAT